MKTFTLALLLAALAAVAQAGAIGACGTLGGCPVSCRAQYGPQANGICQDDEDCQRCICWHTNQPMKTGACDNGCSWSCANKYGYQSDGYCQRSEDEERCICVNVEPLLQPPYAKGSRGQAQSRRY